jgi:hypothetical protein
MEVRATTLNEVLARHTGEIDVVSIDVEGAEFDVLEGFEIRRFRPVMLIIEDLPFTHDRRVAQLLVACGDQARRRVGDNVFYTRADDLCSVEW